MSSSLASVQDRPPELLVAAAADLSLLQDPLAKQFVQTTGIRVRFVMGSSGMLAAQIEQGAPYDVFLSANEKLTADLAASGRLAPDTVRTYALGRLGLWSKNGAIKKLEDLRQGRVLHIAIANPVHAPYGVAAKQALENQGLWKEVESRIVYGENVRQALQYAESGNAEAVITAWPLVYNRGAILLPATLHAPIRQAGAVVAASKARAAALRFLEFLSGPEGRRILEANGFELPPSR